MAASAIGPVLAAVYALLDGDATLRTILGGVGRVHTSHPGDESSPPYVVVPDGTSIPRRVLGGGRPYHDGGFTVEGHADGTSPLKVTDIAERVATLLDGHALSVTGFGTVFCHMGQERRDPMTPGQHRVVLPFTLMLRRS